MRSWTISATPPIVHAVQLRSGDVVDTGIRGPLSRTSILTRLAERYQALTDRCRVDLTSSDLALLKASVELPMSIPTLVSLHTLVEDHIRLTVPSPGVSGYEELVGKLAALSFAERIALADQLERETLPRRSEPS